MPETAMPVMGETWVEFWQGEAVIFKVLELSLNRIQPPAPFAWAIVWFKNVVGLTALAY